MKNNPPKVRRLRHLTGVSNLSERHTPAPASSRTNPGAAAPRLPVPAMHTIPVWHSQTSRLGPTGILGPRARLGGSRQGNRRRTGRAFHLPHVSSRSHKLESDAVCRALTRQRTGTTCSCKPDMKRLFLRWEKQSHLVFFHCRGPLQGANTPEERHGLEVKAVDNSHCPQAYLFAGDTTCWKLFM